MRTFEHFPEQDICVVCGTNKDEECVLIPKAGTEDGNIVEAIPVHVECIDPGGMTYYESSRTIIIFAQREEN